MAIGLGFSVPESAEISWNAGAVYVQNRMNRPIIPAELLGCGIVEPEDLVKRDFKIVFTNGCFDVLHSGHIHVLRSAKAEGDKLVVAVNSDESVKRLKGDSRPLKPLGERMATLAAIDVVDFVVSFDEDTPLKVMNRIGMNRDLDILAKGEEYKDKEIIGSDLVKRVHLIPMIPDVSTTKFLGE
jgi:D-beta-D-heptose 7-phosphate kinase/D-beta-D-heptose 1-phosphate adenosyltransferase